MIEKGLIRVWLLGFFLGGFACQKGGCLKNPEKCIGQFMLSCAELRFVLLRISPEADGTLRLRLCA